MHSDGLPLIHHRQAFSVSFHLSQTSKNVQVYEDGKHLTSIDLLSCFVMHLTQLTKTPLSELFFHSPKLELLFVPTYYAFNNENGTKINTKRRHGKNETTPISIVLLKTPQVKKAHTFFLFSF